MRSKYETDFTIEFQRLGQVAETELVDVLGLEELTNHQTIVHSLVAVVARHSLGFGVEEQEAVEEEEGVGEEQAAVGA